MNGTVLDNPLVREYLRGLKAATATLPAGQARELREQIVAHLEEVLPPEASYPEVEAELRRLGPARSLAAEAAGPVPPPAAVRLRNRLSHLSRRAWTLIAAAVVLLGIPIAGAATYLNSVMNAEPLRQGGLGAWWFPQDRNAHGVVTTAGDVTQVTVPERWGQQQGFVVGIYNYSDWTQTILGADSYMANIGNSPVLIAVGSGLNVDRGGSWDNQTRWDLPGSIPPHSYRLLRVLWMSDICNMPGGTTVFQDVTLRVRVGLITRTEDIQLLTAWAISGTSTSAPASVCH